jgi:hypothetical protein
MGESAGHGYHQHQAVMRATAAAQATARRLERRPTDAVWVNAGVPDPMNAWKRATYRGVMLDFKSNFTVLLRSQNLTMADVATGRVTPRQAAAMLAPARRILSDVKTNPQKYSQDLRDLAAGLEAWGSKTDLWLIRIMNLLAARDTAKKLTNGMSAFPQFKALHAVLGVVFLILGVTAGVKNVQGGWTSETGAGMLRMVATISYSMGNIMRLLGYGIMGGWATVVTIHNAFAPRPATTHLQLTKLMH